MRFFLAAALVISLAACEKEKGDDHVTCEAPGGCGAVHSTLGTGEAHATLLADRNGGVYAALFGSGFEAQSCSGGIICHGELWRIDKYGNVRWKSKEKKSVYDPFLVPGGVGYVTGAGKVVVLDADGDERFSVSTDDPLLAASVIDGALYIAAGGALSRFDLESGDEIWSEPAAEAQPVPAVGTGDGLILTMGFTVGTSGSLTARAFEAPDGKAAWTATLPAQLSAPGLIPGYDQGFGSELAPTMLVSDTLSLRGWTGVTVWEVASVEGFRFVSRSRSNGFFAGGPYFDSVTEYRVNGTVAWSRPMTGAVTWVVPTPDGHVLVGQQDGVVRKLKGNEGTTLWDYGNVDSVQSQSPPIFGGNGNLVFWGANIGVESDTHVSTVTPFGQGIDRWNTGARITSGALSNDDDVFVSTLDGRIYLRDAAQF